jgi:hypothetical protein
MPRNSQWQTIWNLADSAFLGFGQLLLKVRIPWFVVVGCLYFVSLGVGFTRVIPIFSKSYGVGVKLPLPTRILLLSSHFWILPILFAGAAMLNIAKRLAQFSRRQLYIVNGTLIFIVLFCRL